MAELDTIFVGIFLSKRCFVVRVSPKPRRFFGWKATGDLGFFDKCRNRTTCEKIVKQTIVEWLRQSGVRFHFV